MSVVVRLVRALLAVSLIYAVPQAANAAGEPAAGGFKIKPIIDTRLRYEHVDQPTIDANALTFRLRGGIEATNGKLSFLAEGEGTFALVNDYNAFPFAIADSQRRPQYSVVADPQNIELNRLQVQYKDGGNAVTLGRQRINLDDQRWVGSVGWRQNEQTFDAVRGEATLGPVNVDLTYATKQRTIYGTDAGPRVTYSGDFLFASAGIKQGPINAKLFGYVLDYDDVFFITNSSKTFGGLFNVALPLSKHVKVNLKASYARQSDTGKNPFKYSADYVALEAAPVFGPVTATIGWEKLGSDNGRALQTPAATLHKFNGWADVFLTTPNTGLKDLYGGLSMKFEKVKSLPGLNATVTYHQFDSDVGSIDYGHEWDASLGFKLREVGLLAKYANYKADGFGVDTEKFWLQAEWAF